MKLTYECGGQWSLKDEKNASIDVITLSSQISTGFMGTSSIAAFYTGLFITLGGLVRSILVYKTFSVFVYDVNKPEPLLQLCEYIIQMRHEENLEKEEEYYFMLVEILRSPELLKAITGSSLKGELGPKDEENAER